MSIKIMTQIFEDNNLEPIKKLVMLALADNANDEGYCYPSVNTLIKKTSLTKPTIIKHLKELEEMNFIISKKRVRKNGSDTSKIYLIYPSENLNKLDEELKERFTRGGKGDLPGGVKEIYQGGKGDLLPYEPSIEPSVLNHQNNQIGFPNPPLKDKLKKTKNNSKSNNSLLEDNNNNNSNSKLNSLDDFFKWLFNIAPTTKSERNKFESIIMDIRREHSLETILDTFNYSIKNNNHLKLISYNKIKWNFEELRLKMLKDKEKNKPNKDGVVGFM